MEILLTLKKPDSASGHPDFEVEHEKKIKNNEASSILCRSCNNVITDKSSKIQIDGSFAHTFANPHGIIFRIGCFNSAPGVIFSKQESGQFSWFSDFVWSVCACSFCATHLGWRFRKEEKVFFGLVLATLVEKDSKKN